MKAQWMAVGEEGISTIVAYLSSRLHKAQSALQLCFMIDPQLPLIDLHRHLDGSVRLETILDVGLAHNLPLPATTLEGLRPFVQVSEPQPGLLAFLEKFEWMVGILVDYETCRRIAYENVEDARNEGIDYLELRFSPYFMAEPHQLSAEGVVEATIDGMRAGERDFGVKTNAIGIISRTYGPEIGFHELDSLLRYRDDFVALDLAGDEVNYPAAMFVDHFRRGRDAGWQISVHAGEAAGAPSIWAAIDLLGATRIGHATCALDDPALITRLREQRIGIEANLTSNVQTSTVASYADHPLKAMIDQGLLATLNSDDPGISNIDLPYEFTVAAPLAGLTAEDARQAQKNALMLAFLSEHDKKRLAEEKRGISGSPAVDG